MDLSCSFFSSSLAFAAKVSQKLSKILDDSKTSVKVLTCSVQLAVALVQFDQELGRRLEEGDNKDWQKKFVSAILVVWKSVDDNLNSVEVSSSSSASSGIPVDPATASLMVLKQS